MKCPHCQQEIINPGPKTNYCKPCQRSYNRERRVLTFFGLTWDEYELLLSCQDGKCAICGAEAHSIKKHLEASHPEVTVADYRLQFPESPLHSEAYLARVQQLQKEKAEQHGQHDPGRAGTDVAVGEVDERPGQHAGRQRQQGGHVMFGSVLCHYARMSLLTVLSLEDRKSVV